MRVDKKFCRALEAQRSKRHFTQIPTGAAGRNVAEESGREPASCPDAIHAPARSKNKFRPAYATPTNAAFGNGGAMPCGEAKFTGFRTEILYPGRFDAADQYSYDARVRAGSSGDHVLHADVREIQSDPLRSSRSGERPSPARIRPVSKWRGQCRDRRNFPSRRKFAV